MAANAAQRTVDFYSNCEPLKSKILVGEFGKMNQLDAQVKAVTFCEANCK